jgi:hypothetical protein
MCVERSCQCGESHGACSHEFQYAVKVVCGEVKEGCPGESHPPVAPGLYFTAVNIHNPSKCRAARFRWKVAVAGVREAGPVSVYQRTLPLQPGQAVEIDCPQIQGAFNPSPPFVKGYVVLESDTELDVVAVYSGTQGANWPLNSFHTERVQARCVPVCEDLVLPFHTGLADWQTLSPSTGPAVALGALPSSWGTPPFGSSWISQAATDNKGASSGTRVYQLCFDLCFGFATSRFPLQVLADDSAVVTLNNHTVGSVPGFASPTTLVVNPQFLQAGRNCLRIAVTNGPGSAASNPTGFALAGILHAARGKCPCSPLLLRAREQPAALPSEELPADGDLAERREPSEEAPAPAGDEVKGGKKKAQRSS